MTVLAGAASLCIGNAYQAQMPEFATDLGHGHVDFSYSALLAADAAGALVAGLVLESRGLLQARAHTACVLAMIWCAATGSFALSLRYVLALLRLLVSDVVGPSFHYMARTLAPSYQPATRSGRETAYAN